jgi:hypothetical protein
VSRCIALTAYFATTSARTPWHVVNASGHPESLPYFPGNRPCDTSRAMSEGIGLIHSCPGVARLDSPAAAQLVWDRLMSGLRRGNDRYIRETNISLDHHRSSTVSRSATIISGIPAVPGEMIGLGHISRSRDATHPRLVGSRFVPATYHSGSPANRYDCCSACARSFSYSVEFNRACNLRPRLAKKRWL